MENESNVVVDAEVNVETVLSGENENQVVSAKREYPFDTPEARGEITMKIDQSFNVPVIENFNARQAELADKLDNVRSEMYEVKMEIESMNEEIKELNKPKLPNGPSANKTPVLNANIKKGGSKSDEKIGDANKKQVVPVKRKSGEVDPKDKDKMNSTAKRPFGGKNTNLNSTTTTTTKEGGENSSSALNTKKKPLTAVTKPANKDASAQENVKKTQVVAKKDPVARKDPVEDKSANKKGVVVNANANKKLDGKKENLITKANNSNAKSAVTPAKKDNKKVASPAKETKVEVEVEEKAEVKVDPVVEGENAVDGANGENIENKTETLVEETKQEVKVEAEVTLDNQVDNQENLEVKAEITEAEVVPENPETTTTNTDEPISA